MSAEVIGASGLAGRYAQALFDLADEQKKLDTVASDLDGLSAALDENTDLQRLVRSPVIARDVQRDAMVAILEGAGADPLTVQFVGTCAMNRRLFALPGMVSAFRAILAAQRGEEAAEVVSAKPLSKEQLGAIEDALKKAVGTTVAVDARVDESLLGGLVVKMGSRMIDSSLKTKLAQLGLAMKGVA